MIKDSITYIYVKAHPYNFFESFILLSYKYFILQSFYVRTVLNIVGKAFTLQNPFLLLFFSFPLITYVG